MAGADEPKSAILGGAEHHIAVAEQAESRGYLVGAERRDIGAYQHYRTWRASPERALHPDAEIAAALSDGFDPPAPMSGVVASPVRRQRDPQAPAPVGRQTAKQQPYHQSFEMHRRDIADLTCEPALAGSETRCA
jgi:hypothetical protein